MLDVKELVSAAGWTVAEAANRFGVSREYLSRVLAGERPVTAKLAEKAKDAAERTISALKPFSRDDGNE